MQDRCAKYDQFLACDSKKLSAAKIRYRTVNLPEDDVVPGNYFLPDLSSRQVVPAGLCGRPAVFVPVSVCPQKICLEGKRSLLHQNIPLFILIDEMLKGTNSADKLSGSKALLEQLLRLKSNGIVATHDLSLTEMEKQHPENIKNLCFEINLSGEDLIFDYKLQTGVTHTMNTSFLMKKKGIID